jgi:serine protease AprX
MWYNKFWLISSLSLVLATSGFTQNQEVRYAVYFNTKISSNYPYSLEQPLDFLSQRAIERRFKQNIPLDSSDLPVNPDFVTQCLSLDTTIKWIGSSRWLNLSLFSTHSQQVAGLLSQLPFVSSVRPIYLGPSIYKGGTQLSWPSAQSLSLPATITSGQESIIQNSMLGVDYLHNKGALGRDIHIAVLDGGFSQVNTNPAFEHLFTDQRLLGTWDFVAWEPHVFEDNNHGALVLSNMAAFIPNQFSGTAPAASYYLLRSENAATETVSEEFHWVLAAEFADSAGVDIINSSLGYTTFDQPADNYVYAQMNGKTAVSSKAAIVAARKGILVVASAGNSGSTPWRYISAPADADSIIAVGAVDKNRDKANFSSFGPSIDMRTKPDLSAMGRGTAVVGVLGAVATANGTSFASPLLAGALACLWALHPEKSAMEIRQIAKRTAHLFENPNNELGFGIPNLALAHLLLKGAEPSDKILQLFPNPNAGTFKLMFNASRAGIMHMQIFDLQGRMVFQEGWNAQAPGLNFRDISWENASSGVYEVQLNGPKTKLRARLVIP